MFVLFLIISPDIERFKCFITSSDICNLGLPTFRWHVCREALSIIKTKEMIWDYWNARAKHIASRAVMVGRFLPTPSNGNLLLEIYQKLLRDSSLANENMTEGKHLRLVLQSTQLLIGSAVGRLKGQ